MRYEIPYLCGIERARQVVDRLVERYRDSRLVAEVRTKWDEHKRVLSGEGYFLGAPVEATLTLEDKRMVFQGNELPLYLSGVVRALEPLALSKIEGALQ